MVIKSTIPVGYTVSVREKVGSRNIPFSPEFLRRVQGPCMTTSTRPASSSAPIRRMRTFVAAAHEFAALLQEGAINGRTLILLLFMGFTEAEAVKLFANTPSGAARCLFQ